MNSETTQGRKGRQPKPELQREYSDLTKQRHEKIVKKLLDEFDLEKTKDLYRGSQDEVTYEAKPKGLSDSQFRSDLRRLMGSDVIHLNDRKWNEMLQARIREEYEKCLDRKEEKLAEAEEMRIRKLKIDGVISLSDEKEQKSNRHPGKSKGKRHKVKHGHRKRSKSPKQRCNSAPSRPATWYKPHEDIPTQVELMNKSQSYENRSKTDEDVKPCSRKSNRDIVRQNSAKLEHTKSPDEESKPKKGKKKVPEEIKELYEEETVDGLYSMAEKLVIADTSSRVKVKVKTESY